MRIVVLSLMRSSIYPPKLRTQKVHRHSRILLERTLALPQCQSCRIRPHLTSHSEWVRLERALGPLRQLSLLESHISQRFALTMEDYSHGCVDCGPASIHGYFDDWKQSLRGGCPPPIRSVRE